MSESDLEPREETSALEGWLDGLAAAPLRGRIEALGARLDDLVGRVARHRGADHGVLMRAFPDADPFGIATPDEIPAEAASDRACLERHGRRSVRALPLLVARPRPAVSCSARFRRRGAGPHRSSTR